MENPINPLGLPRIVTLATGERLLVTRADADAIVFDRLGSAPTGESETVIVRACGVAGGEFDGFADLVAHLEAKLAGPSDSEQLALLKTTLKQRATQRRWETETGGTVVGGVPIATDDRTKTLLTGADRHARRDPTYTTEWKGADGVWVPIDATTIGVLADAVFDHVDRCFGEEHRLHTAIDAAADLAALEALKPDIEAFTVLPL